MIQQHATQEELESSVFWERLLPEARRYAAACCRQQGRLGSYEDVAQAAICSVWAARKNIDPKKNFAGYVRQTIRSTLKNMYRRKRPEAHSEIPEPAIADSPLESAIAAEDKKRIEDCLDTDILPQGFYAIARFGQPPATTRRILRSYGQSDQSEAALRHAKMRGIKRLQAQYQR